MKKHLIIGADRHGKSVVEVLGLADQFGIIGCLDESHSRFCTSISLQLFMRVESFLVRVGKFFMYIDNTFRENVLNAILSEYRKMINVIHPQTYASRTAQLGHDIKILWRTFLKVINRDGVSH